MFRKYCIWTGVLVSALAASGATVADEGEADELRARAEAIMREVRELLEQGRLEAADRLEREAHELRERAEEMARDLVEGPGQDVARRLQELTEQLAEATRAGKRELARRIQMEIGELLRDVARNAVRRVGRRAEAVVRQRVERAEAAARRHVEQMERTIGELRDNVGPEIAERVAAQWRQALESQRGAVERQPADREAIDLAEDGRRFEQRRQTLERQMAASRERGEHERAERLGDELHEMIANRARNIARRRARPAEAVRRESQMRHAERAEMERRMHHLRAAAENLAAIGMHDLVERLQGEAADIERALHAASERVEPPHPALVEELRHEFRIIHERLDELDRRLDRVQERDEDR